MLKQWNREHTNVTLDSIEEDHLQGSRAESTQGSGAPMAVYKTHGLLLLLLIISEESIPFHKTSTSVMQSQRIFTD